MSDRPISGDSGRLGVFKYNSTTFWDAVPPFDTMYFQNWRELFTVLIDKDNIFIWTLKAQLLGDFSLHLNHLIESHMANYDLPFGTLPFGLFGSNLDTRDLETYPRSYSGHFWNMVLFDNSRAVWVLFRKWVVSENQSFLDEGVIVTPLSV